MLWKRGQLLNIDKEKRAKRAMFSLFFLEDIRNTEILGRGDSDYLNRPPRDEDNDSLNSTLDELEKELSEDLVVDNDGAFDFIECMKQLMICETDKSIVEEAELIKQSELQTLKKTAKLVNHHFTNGHTSFFNAEMLKGVHEETSESSSLIECRPDKQLIHEQCFTPKRELVPTPVQYKLRLHLHHISCSIDCHGDSLCRFIMKERFEEPIPNAVGKCVMKRKVIGECDSDPYASRCLELRLSLMPYVSYSNFEGARLTQPVTNFSQAMDQIRLYLSELVLVLDFANDINEGHG